MTALIGVQELRLVVQESGNKMFFIYVVAMSFVVFSGHLRRETKEENFSRVREILVFRSRGFTNSQVRLLKIESHLATSCHTF